MKHKIEELNFKNLRQLYKSKHSQLMICILDLFPTDITTEILLRLNTDKDILSYTNSTETLQKRYASTENIWTYLFKKKIGGKRGFMDYSTCSSYIRKLNLIGEKVHFSGDFGSEYYLTELLEDGNNILLKFIIDHGFNEYGRLLNAAFVFSNEEIFDYVLAKRTWTYNPLCDLNFTNILFFGNFYRMFLKIVSIAGVTEHFLHRAMYDDRISLIELCVPYLSEEMKESLIAKNKKFEEIFQSCKQKLKPFGFRSISQEN